MLFKSMKAWAAEVSVPGQQSAGSMRMIYRRLCPAQALAEEGQANGREAATRQRSH